MSEIIKKSCKFDHFRLSKIPKNYGNEARTWTYYKNINGRC